MDTAPSGPQHQRLDFSEKVVLAELGPALSSHAGPGVMAVIVLQRPSDSQPSSASAHDVT